MVGADRKQQRLAKEERALEVRPLHRQHRDDDIQRTVLQRAGQRTRRALADVELEIGVRLVQRRQHMGQ